MSLRGPARPYGILVAVKEEAQALLTRLLPRSRGKLGRFPFWRGTLARTEVAMLQCGPGLQNAEEAARILVDRQDPLFLLSVGLAGGLAEEARVGDIVMATDVLSADGGAGEAWAADEKVMIVARRAAEELHELANVQVPGQKPLVFRAVELPLVSMDRVLVTAREKQQAAADTGAGAVDMETRAVVGVARERSLPWFAVRVISDSAQEDLPLDFNQYLDSTGQPQKLKILLEGVKRPSLLMKLIEMEKTTARVGEGLVVYLEMLLPRLEEALR